VTLRAAPATRLRQGTYLGLILASVLLLLGGWHDTRVAISANEHRPYLISLGGSIAAGVGLGGRPYDSPYDLPHACGETNESYAVILAREQHLPLLQVACSGAQSMHGLFSDQVVRHHMLRPQIPEVGPKAMNGIATIFIGANDVHWIHIQAVCFNQGCPAQEPSSFKNGLTSITNDITNAILKLHHDGIRAVVVNEYYTALTQNSLMSCGKYQLTPTDIMRYRTMLQQLNDAITNGYVQAGISSTYLVPLNFDQHGICSEHPWVQGLAEQQPFHPTTTGQHAIAQADQSVLVAHGV